jgi:hypothetical protein
LTSNYPIAYLATLDCSGNCNPWQQTGAENVAHIFAHYSIVTMAMGNNGLMLFAELSLLYVNTTGLLKLVEEIQQDYSQMSINCLCVRSSMESSLQFLCFEAAKPLESILANFYLLSETHQNSLFKQLWTSVLKTEAKAKLPLTFTDVVTRIWIPVMEGCCWLIESVKTRKIKLKDVDFYFRHCDGDVCEHLHHLYFGIEKCYGREPGSCEWIRISVNLMQQYWDLCGQAEAANIILDLKESMNLTGNFLIIENVARQVTLSMKESSLDQVDGRLIGAKSFLEQMTRDSLKLDCLRQFEKCLSIVEWIRKQTKGNLFLRIFPIEHACITT